MLSFVGRPQSGGRDCRAGTWTAGCLTSRTCRTIWPSRSIRTDRRSRLGGREWFVCFVPGAAEAMVASLRVRPASARVPDADPGRCLLDSRGALGGRECRVASSRWMRPSRSSCAGAPEGTFCRFGRRSGMWKSGARLVQLRGPAAFLLGRAFWTWTPHGLYLRLRNETGARRDRSARSGSEAMCARWPPAIPIGH